MSVPEYKLPENAVIHPVLDPSVTAGTKQQNVGAEHYATPYVPQRGSGIGVLHGVDAPTGAEVYEDEFTKAQRAATVARPAPVDVEEITPFPVYVVSSRPAPRELQSIRCIKLTVTDTPMQIVGRDPNRKRLLIRLPSLSFSDLWIGPEPNISVDGGTSWPLNLGSGSDADTNKPGYLELHTNNALYGVASPTLSVVVYVLIEYVEPLDE